MIGNTLLQFMAIIVIPTAYKSANRWHEIQTLTYISHLTNYKIYPPFLFHSITLVLALRTFFSRS